LKKRWASKPSPAEPDLHEEEESSSVEDHEPSVEDHEPSVEDHEPSFESPEEAIVPDAWHLPDVPPDRKSVLAIVKEQEESKVRK